MPTNQLQFYATAQDLAEVLVELEQATPVQYTRSGLFGTATVKTYDSYADIPDFGRCVHSTAVANPTYLVSVRGDPIIVRRVPQHTGGVLFAIDQHLNPNTIAIRPGGRFGNGAILCGMLGTISQRPESVGLYRAVARMMRKSLIRQRQFLVGREASEARSHGVRLTIGANSPREFDLEAAPQD